MASLTKDDSDDEQLVLSSSALDALKEFYAERDARAEQFAKLKAVAEEKHDAALEVDLSMDSFTEDWNESQFWYSDETAKTLAEQLLDGATAETRIAVISAPSVFVAMKNLLRHTDVSERPKVVLLEHDNRFAVFKEFIFYDYAEPFKLPSELKGTIDRFIADPPFLSEDCQTKTALTVRWMSNPAHNPAGPKLISCTGERMENLITTKLYKAWGVKTTDYEVVHARGLSNEFRCYANFEVNGVWKWVNSS